MKTITAVIQPSKLDDVRGVLTSIDMSVTTVAKVHGFGRQRGHSEVE